MPSQIRFSMPLANSVYLRNVVGTEFPQRKKHGVFSIRDYVKGARPLSASFDIISKLPFGMNCAADCMSFLIISRSFVAEHMFSKISPEPCKAPLRGTATGVTDEPIFLRAEIYSRAKILLGFEIISANSGLISKEPVALMRAANNRF